MADNNQCWGYYDSDTRIGYGPAYQYACIHSGSNEYSGGNTVWYNYVTASAGTIIDENTTSDNPVTNTNPTTESICPKGWALPSKTQIDSNKDVTNFLPVLGGGYYNGALRDEDTYGGWWGATVDVATRRYGVFYNGTSLTTTSGLRRGYGRYIRCVQAS